MIFENIYLTHEEILPGLQLRVSVNLTVRAMNWYSTLSRPVEREPLHQMKKVRIF